MAHKYKKDHRFDRSNVPSLRSWESKNLAPGIKAEDDVVLDCGWGRLIFGHTFKDQEKLVQAILKETPGKRDIAIYLRDPHVVLSLAPQDLFMDPSHTYRLWLDNYLPGKALPKRFVIRRISSLEDCRAVNRIYSTWGMVNSSEDFMWKNRKSRKIVILVAEDVDRRQIIGTVTGVDHKAAYSDPENGSSLWCLAVDAQAPHPGVGEAMVRHLAENFMAKGRSYLDLSVMHDNKQAIALYEKLGFQRVPVFCIKRKNPINEPLFTSTPETSQLNPYSTIIIKEARRRGISVEVLDQESGHFALTLGGRTVVCWESLSEMTSAIALCRCDDKSLTRRILRRAGLNVPEQIKAGNREENHVFLQKHGSLVVKPARGEQGAGISVDVRGPDGLDKACRAASRVCSTVLLENYVQGQDLRIIVIDFKVVAGAVRKPAEIVGTGRHTIKELIQKQSRRRRAATGGESKIPLDGETKRCVAQSGYDLESILPAEERLEVRKTANLHTGGTIHDVTEKLHPELVRAAEHAARAINIPVVGLDFLVSDVTGPEYVIIEANERPGLANHEPQPTAQRYVDFLFPQTVV
ncbi:N-acetylglutaminylglutamine synthetase [Desulfonatronovibrio hydrogenovorans]|uniref:N-acetylglutaminylglutamine synthetase n=1 Tax=Desulfonatronovibrio hydrogenovorans TaxID=53245 RepID=UPI00048C043B|nr:N-acetylglutaminylglutamine synthetase [Desulfonatronovibrio hydrogenovorans]